MVEGGSELGRRGKKSEVVAESLCVVDALLQLLMSICSLATGMPALNCSVAAWPIRQTQTLISTNQLRSSYVHTCMPQWPPYVHQSSKHSPICKSPPEERAMQSPLGGPGAQLWTSSRVCVFELLSLLELTLLGMSDRLKLTLVEGGPFLPALPVGVMWLSLWVVGHVWLWSLRDCISSNLAHSNFDGSSQKGSVVYTECLLAMSLLYGVEVAVFACVCCMEVTALPVSSPLSECWAAGKPLPVSAVQCGWTGGAVLNSVEKSILDKGQRSSSVRTTILECRSLLGAQGCLVQPAPFSGEWSEVEFSWGCFVFYCLVFRRACVQILAPFYLCGTSQALDKLS